MNSEIFAVFCFDKGIWEDCKKKSSNFFIFDIFLFSVDINTLSVNFHMECIKLQSDIDHVSLLDFSNTYLSREEYPLLHNHALFMSSLFSSMYFCEQLFSRTKLSTASKLVRIWEHYQKKNDHMYNCCTAIIMLEYCNYVARIPWEILSMLQSSWKCCRICDDSLGRGKGLVMCVQILLYVSGICYTCFY